MIVIVSETRAINKALWTEGETSRSRLKSFLGRAVRSHLSRSSSLGLYTLDDVVRRWESLGVASNVDGIDWLIDAHVINA